MPYVFVDSSNIVVTVYVDELLTDQDKQGGIYFDSIPEPPALQMVKMPTYPWRRTGHLRILT
jgi:hypothetical protein